MCWQWDGYTGCVYIDKGSECTGIHRMNRHDVAGGLELNWKELVVLYSEFSLMADFWVCLFLYFFFHFDILLFTSTFRHYTCIWVLHTGIGNY